MTWVLAQTFGPDYEPEPPLTLVPKRHRDALLKLEAEKWKGVRDGGLQGNTQDALVRLGVAESRWATKPYGHQQARLTALGVRYVKAHLSIRAEA